jgi:hypothetical protein
MAMQLGLDELISMLLARMDGMSIEDENIKSRFNIVARVLYKKGIITDQDVIESVKDEHKILKDIGLIEKEPDQAAVENIANSITLWLKCDSATIRKSMEEYERKVQEAMARQQQQKSKLDVAPAAALQQLDRMSGKQASGGKKIIF